MSHASGRDDQPKTSLPNLPGDPYGRDTDLYPPVPDFPRYDYWDESNFDGNYRQDAADMVVHDRYSEIPSVAASAHQQNIGNTETPARRRSSTTRSSQSAAPNADVVYDNVRPVRPRQPARRHRRDRVTGTTLNAAAIPGDLVTGTRAISHRRVQSNRARRPGGGNPAWQWTRVVMPSFRQMLEQALPTMVMALSLVLGLLVIDRAPFLEGVWAAFVLIPSVVFYLASDAHTRPMWRRSALMNLTAVGVFYPLLIVRQSYLRVPYVEWGNGTLAMPLAATLTVVLLLAAIALAAAWMSQDDPEYAGVLFLPAAMLVPFFAGATEIVSLRTALIIAAGVFLTSSVLTVVASMLPGAYPMLVAPIALALEFMVLPLSDSVPIFPMGAGTASKLLFFVVLATTVGFTAAMPSMAGWVRQVRDIVNTAHVPTYRSS